MTASYRLVYRFGVLNLILSSVFLLSFYNCSQQRKFGFPWAAHRDNFIFYSSASNNVLKDFKGFCWHRLCYLVLPLGDIFSPKKPHLFHQNPKFLLIPYKSTGSNPNEGLFIPLHLIMVFISLGLFSSPDTQRQSQGSFAETRGLN